MSPLLIKQQRFSIRAAKLILHAEELGYAVTLGEAFRSPAEAKRRGFPDSNHVRRLAIDLQLFDSNGFYLTAPEAYNRLHDYWAQQGGAARIPADLNHYSLEWRGIR